VEIYSKVAGTTFRPVPWDRLHAGDELKLVPEPENEYDHWAVAIYHGSDHIGYVRAKSQTGSPLAREVFEAMENGRTATAKVMEITGVDKDNHGINIQITIGDDKNLDMDAIAYQNLEARKLDLMNQMEQVEQKMRDIIDAKFRDMKVGDAVAWGSYDVTKTKGRENLYPKPGWDAEYGKIIQVMPRDAQTIARSLVRIETVTKPPTLAMFRSHEKDFGQHTEKLLAVLGYTAGEPKLQIKKKVVE